MSYKDMVFFGDALEQLQSIPDETAQMCVTSPPYWGLRDYGVDRQVGLEETPDNYVQRIVSICCEIKRVLKNDGTFWLNLGDSYNSAPPGKNPGGFQGDKMKKSNDYNKVQTRKKVKGGYCNGLKPKDLVGIPWRVAFALQQDEWYLRSDIIWHKPNPMPESVTDRPTNSHEHIFLLSKSKSYYYDHEAIMEDANYDGRNDTKHKGSEKYAFDVVPGSNPQSLARESRERWPNKKNGQRKRNKRDVWQVNTKPYKDAHFAVYPPELIAPCIKAGSKEYDIVLDPFFGSGTTGVVCQRLNRHYLGVELNKDYKEIQDKRLAQQTLRF